MKMDMTVTHTNLQGDGTRYTLKSIIGEGAFGATYLGVTHAGEKVAIKVFAFQQARKLKDIQLFKREVSILRHLNHPLLPKFVDYFEIDDGELLHYYLVQQYIPGKNLSVLLKEGMLFDEACVRKIALDVLDVLSYLHGFSPPVIHRDIKPGNIILGDDGRAYLVDFGAVRDQLKNLEGGSTVVGTPGFMPFEQFSGRAWPATDIYALGATMINLLSRKDPGTMLGNAETGIDFHGHVSISSGFENILKKCVMSQVKDRFDDDCKLLICVAVICPLAAY